MILDEQQQAVVESTAKNILCVAGPGSGKTRTLIERTAHLIESKKVSPSELVLFTFTRHAAQEMRTRLQDRIGDKARRVTIGTFHAIALSLFHRFGDLAGYRPRSITVYGNFEEEFLLKECARDLGFYNGKSWKVPKKVITEAFNEYYHNGKPPKEDHPGYALFKEFNVRTKENNSMTYGDLLVRLRELLPQISKYLSWKHIMVDESHDNNLIQWELVLKIQEDCAASLFVVTDLDQSIYKWRGAFPEWILKNQWRFTIFKLENNYRSVPAIVEASNRLIKHNIERIPKTMRATRYQDPIADVIEIIPNSDSGAIASLISEIRAYDSRGMVVLSRIHALLDKLSVELTALNIPHVKIGRKTALVESEEFRKFHAFLKLLINPFDNFSFLLIRDLIGVSREEYNKIRLGATQESKSHFQVWFSSNNNYDFFGETYTILESVEYLNKNFPELSQESYIFALEWEKGNPNGTITEYLDWLATYDIQDEIEEDHSDKVQLMTIHAAKGLEFPVVIVAGCNEGILPGKQAINSGEIGEERRLFYVAMTRAKDNLILTVRPEKKEDEFGRVHESPVSRFINEMEG
jgi:DNA helicase-2/ATP-dependent DNA helicase PcrA